jgi:tryptophanase
VTRENRYPKLELVRFAVPRRVYTSDHIRYTAAVAGKVMERANLIQRGYRLTREAPILRHFTMELEPVKA